MTIKNRPTENEVQFRLSEILEATDVLLDLIVDLEPEILQLEAKEIAGNIRVKVMDLIWPCRPEPIQYGKQTKGTVPINQDQKRALEYVAQAIREDANQEGGRSRITGAGAMYLLIKQIKKIRLTKGSKR